MANEPLPVATGTAVTIYGRTYHLRGNEDGVYLTNLAAIVDGKMREVAEATGTSDTTKVAILAALNIADDYVQAAQGVATVADGADARRVERMVSRLREVLAG